MPALTERDRKTLRYAGIGLAVYLVLFFGLKSARGLQESRNDYLRLVQEEELLRQQIQAYDTKELLIEKLKHESGLDRAGLSRDTIAGEAAAAIVTAAKAGGIKLGPIREGPGNRSANALAGMRLEATGQIRSVTALLDQIGRLGFPLVIRSVQLEPDPRQPGQITVNLEVEVLDFEGHETERGGRDA